MIKCMYSCDNTRRLDTRLRKLSTTLDWRLSWCYDPNYLNQTEINNETTFYGNFKARARQANAIRGHVNRKFTRGLRSICVISLVMFKTDKSNCCSHGTLFREATCEFKRRSAVNYALHSREGKTGEGQDLAEPETFEAEATLVSTLYIRAMKALKFCSISVSLAANPPSAVVTCDSLRYIQPVIVGICAICSLLCAKCERRASSFSSAVTSGRVPVPSRSEPETSGEPKFEELNCEGEFGTSLSGALTTRGCDMKPKDREQLKAKSGDQKGTVKHVG